MAVIVIPARYASTRFPGKPLTALRGATGDARALIRRAWDAAMAVPGVDGVWVATDDDRIASAAHGFGAQVVMTPESCRNGTERVAAAVATLGLSDRVVVNLQGDAPLTPPWFVTALIDAMRAPDGPAVATPVLRCTPDALAMLREDRRNGRVGGTTAVLGAQGRALYFSKEVLPFGDGPVFHHVGVYAYTPQALATYGALPPGALEAREGLEQLRFLEHGHPVACVEVADRGRAFWEVNTPEDVARVESVLQAEGIA